MSKQEITFADSIARLTVILQSLGGFMNILESEEMDDEILNQSFAKIAKSLKPDMSDEDVQEVASTAIVTFAFNEAVECTHRLMAAWGAANPPNPEKAETLMHWAVAARTGDHEVDKAQIIKNIPWLLEEALGYICNDCFTEDNQLSDAAIGARMLACLSAAVNDVPGLKHQPDDDCRLH